MKPLQLRPERTDQCTQVALIILEIAHGLKTGAVQHPLRDLAHPMEHADGPRPQETDLLPFRNERQPVGLLVVAGDLGQELVGRDAHGGSQLSLRSDPLLQLPGQRQRCVQRRVRILGLTELG